MRRYLVGLLATIGALTVICVAAGIYVASSTSFASKPLPKSMTIQKRFAAAVLALGDEDLADRLDAWRARQSAMVRSRSLSATIR